MSAPVGAPREATADAVVRLGAPLWRRALGELVGTGALVAVVVGSGIAATNLSPDDVGLQLLENSIATALGLAVLIAVLGPLSGAHFNPVVTLVDWVLGRRKPAGPRLGDVGAYLTAQVAGGVGGALLANAMFGEPAAVATTERASSATLLAEVVATAGLVLVIVGLLRTGRDVLVAPAVGAYIGAAYWFTSSTSFANPAVTVGRMFSDTFAGIAPGSVLPFVLAQLVGGAVGVGLAVVLYPARADAPPT
jgi:glycerol uptake facilitator-like aquaporin